MAWICLIVGLVFLVLDRLFDKGKIAALKERLSFFIDHYHPEMGRTPFLTLLLLIIFISAVFDYLIYTIIDLNNYIIIMLILFGGLYLAIFFLAIIHHDFPPKTDFWLNFFRMERELIQQFALGLCQPLFALAYLIRGFLMLLIYPENGILIFHSASGLVGFILITLAAIAHFTQT